MKSKRSPWIYGIVSALSLAAMAIAGPGVAVADDEPPDTASPATVRVTLELPHPLSLDDAITASASLKEQVVAFAFTTDNVTGEYAPLSMPASEFLAYFEEDFGSQPEVTGIVVLRTTEDKTSTPTHEKTNLGSDLPAFGAPPVVLGGLPLQRKEAADAYSDAAREGTGARPSPDWRADYTAQAAVNRGSSAYIGGYFSFLNLGLQNLPLDVGIEFEVNQKNPAVFAPTNVRPLCFDASFKDRFWASNYSYSWTATDSWAGGGIPTAYADYNDDEDLCQTNSIAIGIRYPGLVSAAPPFNDQEIDIAVFAPKGLLSSSAISGNIQTVSDQFCDAFPLMALTDCMGVTDITGHWGGYPSGEYNQSTLNISRAWSAPGRCWETTGGTFAELTPCS